MLGTFMYRWIFSDPVSVDIRKTLSVINTSWTLRNTRLNRRSFTEQIIDPHCYMEIFYSTEVTEGVFWAIHWPSLIDRFDLLTPWTTRKIRGLNHRLSPKVIHHLIGENSNLQAQSTDWAGNSLLGTRALVKPSCFFFFWEALRHLSIKGDIMISMSLAFKPMVEFIVNLNRVFLSLG